MISKKNKHGWMEIVEAFTSILLIAGVLIILAGNLRLDAQDFSSQVYDSEYAILREIQLDNSLRNAIISASPLPVEFENLGEVKIRVEEKTPSYLECTAKLCGISDVCTSEIPPGGKDIFVKSVFIGANLDGYSPRKLNLFCWSK